MINKYKTKSSVAWTYDDCGNTKEYILHYCTAQNAYYNMFIIKN